MLHTTRRVGRAALGNVSAILVGFLVAPTACTEHIESHTWTSDGGSAGSEGGGGDGGAPAPVPQTEYEECDSDFPIRCADSLECIVINEHGAERCLRPCTLESGGECDADQSCVPQYDDPASGFCATNRDFFEACGPTDSCGRNAICGTGYSGICNPICDVGDLVDKQAVETCPPTPDAWQVVTPECMLTGTGSTHYSICGGTVPVGARCNYSTLRCADSGDTAPLMEGVGSALDPGTTICFERPGFGCTRICSIDGGQTVAPCACPPNDPYCTDPVDPGLEWSCEASVDTDFAEGVWGCVLLEECTTNECEDNVVSGLTECTRSPYASTGPMTCSGGG